MVEFVKELNLPGEQAVHSDMPESSPKRPAAQKEHSDEPLISAKLPAAHGKQPVLLPTSRRNLPFEQAVHSDRPGFSPYLPAEQKEHSEEPLIFAKLPMAHCAQPVVLFASRLKLPGKQAVHAVEPWLP
mmetsp:Transcript_29885/g.52811  ORF Transcript_29885/g.52811 Transcript_29885/m.52811 type:complete len:129 (-) Transcript_29885:77-463(-)